MTNDGVISTLQRRYANLRGRPYGASFFAGQSDGSLRSAEVIVPLVVDLVAPRSVLDVGCGTGAWLSVFRALGIEDVLGVDGAYVPVDQLAIPVDCFRVADLSAPLITGRRFDLAVSVEVAEHLPRSASERFVASLTAAADVVLFSAAIPRQGGSHHLNEQWQTWWAQHFAARGFVPVDCVRRHVWSNPAVAWWYAQNTLMYVAEERLASVPALATEHAVMGVAQLALVHPERLLKWRKRLRRTLA